MNSNFIQGLQIDWSRIAEESYLRDIPALRNLTELSFTHPVTCLVGENGTGKSTLLEAIAVAAGFNPEGGSRNFRFSTCDSHSELCGAMRLIRSYRRPAWSYFLRAESFYNVATQAENYRDDDLEEYYYARYGGKSLHHLNPMARVFWLWCRPIFSPRGCICWMSPRLRCLPSAS